MNRDLLLRRMAEGLKGSVHEMSEALPWSIHCTGTAVSVLAKKGHIECYGQIVARTPSGGGMPAKRWRISAAGMEWTKARFWWVKTWPVEVLRG